jgi:hypothetical protein
LTAVPDFFVVDGLALKAAFVFQLVITPIRQVSVYQPLTE